MLGLLTVGHGNLDRTALGALLRDAAVEVVVDIRRYPSSRRNPDVRRESLEQWLPETGIQYRWEERLGGRRHIPAGATVLDTWWTDAAFRAYAAYTRSDEFAAGMADLLALVHIHHVVVMCSETLWWRCHRRLIADIMTLEHQIAVDHLLPSGRRGRHEPAAGARQRADGRVVWDLPFDSG